MKLRMIVLALGLAGAVAVPSAMAADAERDALQRKLVERWSDFVEDTYKLDGARWANEMAPAFELASIEELRAANKAGSFDAMNEALLGPAQDGTLSGLAASTKVLGATDADLVYVPITPCRIFDTRLAGGVIAAGTARSFDVTAVSDYSFQGGSASNCGGAGAAGSFAAVVINLTAVSPSNVGFVTAYPFGATQPLSASLVYTTGGLVSNEVVLRLDQGASANEMTAFSSAQTHLVGDITGYFINPQATALQCVDTADTSTPVAAGATANSVAPACAAGYTQTATNCESSTWQMPFVFFSGGTCSAQNNSASAATLRSSRTCCRVPGR